MPNARIVLSVINDLTGDQRVHRIASSLQESGYQVLVVGRRLPESLPLSERPYTTHRLRLWFRKGKLFYLEFTLRLFFYLLRKKAAIYTANDLDTLLPNFLIARLRRAKLMYDSHEWFTEVPELIGRTFTRRIWLWLEKRLFPRVDQVSTVNASLAKIYSDTYQREVAVIRNVPLPKPMPVKQTKEKVLLYQGALNIGRGLELMIEAMAYLPDYQLWIIGRGDIVKALKSLAHNIDPAGNRIRFWGFIPLEKLHALTLRARWGFSLEEDRGGNYHYASPNKLYDYVQAGVPVLASDLPEMRALIEEYGVGDLLLSDQRNPQALADAIRKGEEHHHDYRQACLKAAQHLNWEQERTQLLKLYSTLTE